MRLPVLPDFFARPSQWPGIFPLYALFLFISARRLFLFTYPAAILNAITLHGFMINAVKEQKQRKVAR
jgi:hypothetical protein